ncbi:NADPH oxidase [Trametes elegans]|nr:NADPH oxidase [Trametes elegans]
MGESWFQREFLQPRRLAFNVIFYGVQLFLFGYGWYSQETNKKLAALNALTWSVWTSRGAGLVLAFDGGMILVPMLRNIIRVVRPRLTWLFPADENIWFHRQVAYSMAFWTMVHTTAHYVNFFNVERTQVRPGLAIDIHYHQAGGITGHFMLLIMVLIYTTAHHKIRHQCFEAFWYTHHLAFFFMIGLYSHATGCFVRDSATPAYTAVFPFYTTDHCLGYESWRYTIWPGIFYFGERIWREIRARRATRLSKVLVHPSGLSPSVGIFSRYPGTDLLDVLGAMELRIIKPSFKYVPGQWLFIQVPDISGLQWHPFTITSAPEDSYVSVHIRQVGDWTYALGERVGAGPQVVAAMTKAAIAGQEKDDSIYGTRGDFVEIDAAGRALPAVRIDGPYGAPAEDVFNVEVAVLIGAGIGVTPFASILKHIWYRQKRGTLGSLKRVEFFWVCRDAPSFGWFQTLLQEVEAAQADRECLRSKHRCYSLTFRTAANFLRINIYLTQKISEDMLWNIAVNDAGAEYDPLTLLRTRTMFGRPDWKTIYGRMAQAIQTGQYLPGTDSQLKTKVGTYFCGPGVLAKAIKEACQTSNSANVEFMFAKVQFPRCPIDNDALTSRARCIGTLLNAPVMPSRPRPRPRSCTHLHPSPRSPLYITRPLIERTLLCTLL